VHLLPEKKVYVLEEWSFQVENTRLEEQIGYCCDHVLRLVVVLVGERQQFRKQGSSISACHLLYFAEKAPKKQEIVNVLDKVTGSLFHQCNIISRI
jgi:hypothetical protein